MQQEVLWFLEAPLSWERKISYYENLQLCFSDVADGYSGKFLIHLLHFIVHL